ncbi:MAG: hypothetical protein HYY99_00100 [Candidatus Colwellbacteria bacterium]|nr:hypothetical protein [Candidatus Colwellbacteria bacterium]MBI3088656.1 hypothetical protein [Candidatus Colwellbacteria bacterium]
MIKRDIDINRLVEDALQIPDNRAKRIILHRYCLGVPNKRTLADLGQEYNLTRERIRQIEAATLKAVRKRLENDAALTELIQLIHDYLNDAGNLRRADWVARDFAVLLKNHSEEEELYHKLHFLAHVIGEPHITEANEEWHPFWYNKKEAHDTAKTLVSHLMKSKEYNFDKFLKNTTSKFNLPEAVVINHLSVSKKFMAGPYGDLGAAHWPHVNPKTVREKAYLVLVKENHPLHFREIAELVNKIGNRERAPATVHNELIKDPRFILVGRGTYTLNG